MLLVSPASWSWPRCSRGPHASLGLSQRCGADPPPALPPAPCRCSKARFLELVGESTNLPDALRIIAHDCPKSQPGSRRLADPCQAFYLELADQPGDNDLAREAESVTLYLASESDSATTFGNQISESYC